MKSPAKKTDHRQRRNAGRALKPQVRQLVQRATHDMLVRPGDFYPDLFTVAAAQACTGNKSPQGTALALLICDNGD
ncbi:hypothetical protein [Pseudomonas synxantha]|uniref:hypothetical protein n=1 Tax=Pseudomonas synxantha TaxID=47883 RepID=UPI0013DD8CC5